MRASRSLRMRSSVSASARSSTDDFQFPSAVSSSDSPVGVGGGGWLTGAVSPGMTGARDCSWDDAHPAANARIAAALHARHSIGPPLHGGEATHRRSLNQDSAPPLIENRESRIENQSRTEIDRERRKPDTGILAPWLPPSWTS